MIKYNNNISLCSIIKNKICVVKIIIFYNNFIFYLRPFEPHHYYNVLDELYERDEISVAKND
jgi:hypothetical protein